MKTLISLAGFEPVPLLTERATVKLGDILDILHCSSDNISNEMKPNVQCTFECEEDSSRRSKASRPSIFTYFSDFFCL